MNGNDNNWYCVVPNGIYNGQLKKVVLHPVWDSSNNGHVNIAINRFCDPDGSIFTSNYSKLFTYNYKGENHGIKRHSFS